MPTPETWMLSLTFYDGGSDKQKFFKQSAKGETAAEAYFSVIDEYEKAYEEGKTSGRDQHYAYYAQAILVGAWPLTPEQVKRADEDEGW